MRNNRAILMAIAAMTMGLAQLSFAQQAGTVGELSAVQSETLLIKAKAARAAAQAELDKNRPVPVMVSAPRSQRSMDEEMAERPVNLRVSGVHGVGGKRMANVLLGDGSTRSVGVGEVIDGVKIVKVGIDEVTVSQRGRESTVPVITTLTSSPARSAGMPMPGIPNIPGVN